MRDAPDGMLSQDHSLIPEWVLELTGYQYLNIAVPNLVEVSEESPIMFWTLVKVMDRAAMLQALVMTRFRLVRYQSVE